MNKPLASLAPASAAKARFTKAEFLTMAATGAFDDMKIELVEGELERMNPPMSEHGRRQMAVGILLHRAIAGTGYTILGDTGIDLDEESVVACNVAIVRHAPDSNRLVRPEELILVVEIAETTQQRDMGQKRVAYAAAGIPHYWVVDGERRVVHVFADPVRGDYAEISTVRFGAPLAVPGTDRAMTIDS